MSQWVALHLDMTRAAEGLMTDMQTRHDALMTWLIGALAPTF